MKIFVKINSTAQNMQREVKCDPPYIKQLKEPKKRIRSLSESETQGLIMALSPHLADMTSFH